MFGLAIYTHTLAPDAIARHFALWKKTRDFSMAVSANPEILYLLDDVPGQQAFNRMGDTRYLIIPAKVQILKKEILSLPWDHMRWAVFWKDAGVNFWGFVPLGFFLSALMVDFGRINARRNYLYGVGLCFILSLGIELTQAWIPSRSSQLLDLVLNTLGGVAGIVLQRLHWHRREKQRRPLSI